MYNLLRNNCRVLYHSTNAAFKTRSSPYSYIFLKFSDRCKEFYIEKQLIPYFRS